MAANHPVAVQNAVKARKAIATGAGHATNLLGALWSFGSVLVVGAPKPTPVKRAPAKRTTRKS
jgi:hypothetical protein